MYRIIFAFIITGILSCKDQEKPVTTDSTGVDSTSGSAPFGSIQKLDDALTSIISDSAKVEIIADGFEWSEGPLWIEQHNMLLFSDVPKNTVYKWTESKGKEVYLQPSGYTHEPQRGGETGSNGLALKDGKLLLCQHGNRQVATMESPLDSPKAVFKAIAANYQGKKFNSPNDAAVRSNGDVFFTDPPYGLEKYINDPLKEIKFQGVYKASPDGKVTLLVDSLTRPNGIVFSPDEKRLIVANSGEPKKAWYYFEVGPGDKLINGRIFYDATNDPAQKGAPDGLKSDKNGNIFATGPGGVWIFNWDGKVLGKILIPESTSNVALSPDEKTLYITADMYVLRVKMRS